MSNISELNETFRYPYTEFSSQNCLTTLLNYDLIKIQFILYISKQSFRTIDDENHRFEPNPFNYFPVLYPNEPINKDDIKTFFQNVEDQSFYQILKSFNSDQNLINHFTNTISPNFVKLLYFFIFTNNIAFNSIGINNVFDNEVNVFNVSHKDDKELEFHNISGESKILMHGTSNSNIYSIMKNGIKTMSNTKYETNGKLYGDGIYLSDNLVTILKYCDSDYKCILFFDCKNLNKSKNNYCYVQQENEIILRTICLINININYNFIEIIHNHIRRFTYVPKITKRLEITNNSNLLRLPTNENVAISGDRVTKSKRFQKEILRFSSLFLDQNEKTLVRFNFIDPNDNKTPLMVLVMPNSETDLYKDLIRYNIPGLLLSLWFPGGVDEKHEFPFFPFKMRLVNPMLIDGTGRVTKGGSLCGDQLFKEGWSPLNTIESIIRNFIIAIGTEGSREGPGRVDPDRLGKSYTYEKYLESHNFVAGVHGYTS